MHGPQSLSDVQLVYQIGGSEQVREELGIFQGGTIPSMQLHTDLFPAHSAAHSISEEQSKGVAVILELLCPVCLDFAMGKYVAILEELSKQRIWISNASPMGLP